MIRVLLMHLSTFQIKKGLIPGNKKIECKKNRITIHAILFFIKFFYSYFFFGACTPLCFAISSNRFWKFDF